MKKYKLDEYLFNNKSRKDSEITHTRIPCKDKNMNKKDFRSESKDIFMVFDCR